MPFARRRDVQVLEDDRSEYLLQRTATIWMLFGQNKKTKPRNPRKTIERQKKRKNGRYLSSGIYCSALMDS